MIARVRLISGSSWVRLMQAQSTNNKKPQIDPNVDYYKLLDLTPTATIVEIKKSYYLNMRKYHPDFNEGLTKELEQTKIAYEILSDPDLKFQYDSMLAKKNNKEPEPDTKKQEKNYDDIGPGPYQSEEQYRQYSQKGFYGKSRFEWRKIRMGTRKQSYIGYESNTFYTYGATTDYEIDTHHEKRQFVKKISEQNLRRQLGNKQEQEKEKARQQVWKARHQEKIRKAKESQKGFWTRVVDGLRNLIGSNKTK